MGQLGPAILESQSAGQLTTPDSSCTVTLRNSPQEPRLPKPFFLFIHLAANQCLALSSVTVRRMNERNRKTGTSVGIGIIVGVVIGALTDNYGLWIALGLVFGTAWGTQRSKRSDD